MREQNKLLMGVTMGLFQSKEEGEAKKRNLKIQSQILKDKEKSHEIIKLLLLGAAESGKSTVLKQMRIWQENGFTQEELTHQKEVIRNNIVTCMLTLLDQMNRFQISFASTSLEKNATLIRDLSRVGVTSETFSEDLIDAMKCVWEAKEIKEIYEKRNEYYLTDSAAYFLDSIDRIGEKGYTPTEQDILRARVRTTGIIECRFQPKLNIDLRVIDVGGQRSERKKWIHCFDDVNGIIFVASLTGYNQVILEDNMTNRMQESIRLFSSVCNSDFFMNTAMIIFLNKIDLFAESINKQPITVSFPNYKGPNTVAATTGFIEEEYNRVNKMTDKSIFVHKTCATDTSQMQFVIKAVFELILKRALERAGLF